jgi:hypothetical protein
MSEGLEFPAFLKIEHRPSPETKAQFIAEVDAILDGSQRRFESAFGEIDQVIKRSAAGMRSGNFKFDFDVSALRQTAVEAEAAVQRLRQMRDAAAGLAERTGDTTEATKTYIQALRAQVAEAERAKQMADAQVTTYSRLQAEIDRTVASNRALTQSLRATYLEQARAENFAHRRQQGTNEVFALGLTAKATDNGAGFGALEAYARQEEQARQAMARLADEAQRLRSALDPTMAIQERFNDQLTRAETLYRAGAITTREYAQAQQLARETLQTSHAALTASSDAAKAYSTNVVNLTAHQGRLRQASIGAGQQLQDIAISLYSGQQAGIVFAQQLPQLAFGLSGLEGSTNRTQDRIGKFATFLSGPWGLAVGLGVGALATLVSELWSTEEAAKAAELGADGLSQAQGVLGNMFDLASGKIERQNELLVLNARLTALNLRAEAMAQRDSSRQALGNFQTGSLGLSYTNKALGALGIPVYGSTDREQQVRAVAGDLKSGRITREEALQRSEKLDFKGLAITKTEFQQALIDEVSAEFKDRTAGLIDKSLEDGNLAPELRREGNNRKKDRKGPDESKAASRELERLKSFGDQAAESIARISEQFDDQPRLVDKSAQAVRSLDDVIAKLNSPKNSKLANREELVAKAYEAQRAAAAAVATDIERYREANARNLDVLNLQAQGLNEQAAILQEINRLDERYGLTKAAKALAQQRDDLQAILTDEELVGAARADAAKELDAINAKLADNATQQKNAAEAAADYVKTTNALNQQVARTNELMQAQLGVLDAARGGLKDILSGRSTDFFGNLKQSIKDLQGARLFDSLFGDAFDGIENELRKQTPLGKANARLTTEIDQAAIKSTELATAMDGAATIITQAAQRIALNDNIAVTDPSQPGTVVEGRLLGTVAIASPSIQRIADLTGFGITKPLADILERTLGVNASDALGLGLGGYLTGGAVGGLLGGLKGLVDSQKTELQKSFDKTFGDSGLSGDIGNALKGAQTGAATSGIMKSLGIKTSTTAAQIGGALGAASGIPGADIIASITWGFIGGLFKKTKSGSATIGNLDGSLGISGTGGNSGKYIEAASDGAGGIISSINRIADALGGIVDPSRGSVSLGIRHGDYRVDTTGSGITKKNRGAIDFNEDASAAIAFATYDLIRDGVITGLRATTQRILQTGDDLDAALQKALDFEDVFSQLKEFRDPVGAALDGLDREFTRLKKLFQDSNATTQEYADLEELYNLKRAEAVKQASEQIIGSLKDLRDQLNIGDSGLSLRARLTNARAAFDPLEARVKAGDTTAYDDYAKAAATLLDLQKELSGSQGEYFALFDQINSLTATAIAAQEAIASASANRDSPFSDSAVPATDNASVVGAIDRQTTILVDALTIRLDAINDNIGTLVERAYAVGGGTSAAGGLNFSNQF